MQFINPKILYLLFIIPVILLLYILSLLRHKYKLSKFGRLDIIQNLMPDVSSYMGWIKMTLDCIAIAFLIVALARPFTPTNEDRRTEEETTNGIEIMICMDISNSMLASTTDDPKGLSRLQRAKYIVEKLIERLKNDRFGIIVFASEPSVLVPLTTDNSSAKSYIREMNTDYMDYAQGTAIGLAISSAINSFSPDENVQKAIVLITDSENFEDNALNQARMAAELGIQIDVIGLGTEHGAPIKLPYSMKDYNLDSDGYILDNDGSRVITSLNVSMAHEIAKEGKGIFLQGASSSVISDICDQLNQLSKTEIKRERLSTPAGELFPLATLIALILLSISGFLPYSKISWLKNINFFTDHNEKSHS